MAEAKINANETREPACPNCGAPSRNAHFCSECGKIQPVEAGTDYFAFFGLPRKLELDEAALEKSFYSLSRQLHPDYFMAASAEERQSSVERSSMLNDAYRALRDRVSRAGYLLELEGYKESEKKAPPDLLEEVFELNMQIEELKAAKKMGDEDEVNDARASLEEARQGLKEKLGEIDKRLFALFSGWNAAVDKAAAGEERKAALDPMSQLLSRRSYISNLLRDVEEEL
jgi:molecular chaperone HscB